MWNCINSCYLLFRGFILLYVQFSKNITKWLLFIIIHIFSIHFAINLLYLHNLKTWKKTMGQQPHHAREWTKSKQNKTKSHHIQINHAFYCSFYPTKNAMVSLKDGLPVWRQDQKEDFLSIIYQCSAQPA